MTTVDQQGGAAMPKDKPACGLSRQLIQMFISEGAGTIPLGYVDTFLMIAADEGHSVNEYVERAHVSKGVILRRILGIGDWTRDYEPGLGWVTAKPSPNEPKRQEIFLTAKGHSLERRLTEVLDLWASTKRGG
jgi:hypothetical protein